MITALILGLVAVCWVAIVVCFYCAHWSFKAADCYWDATAARYRGEHEKADRLKALGAIYARRDFLSAYLEGRK